MAIKPKLEALLAKVNETTGKSSVDLTDGIKELIDGYGEGGSCDIGSIVVSAIPGSQIECGDMQYTLSSQENQHSFTITEEGEYTIKIQKDGLIDIRKVSIYKSSKTINSVGGVPQGYSTVEYIEATGSQYINTGILPNAETFGYDVKFKMNKDATSGTQTFSLIYNSWSSSSPAFMVGLGSYNRYRLLQTNNAGWGSSSGVDISYNSEIIEMSLHGDKITVNGNDEYQYTRNVSGTAVRPITIFATNSEQLSVVEFAYARCYYYKLYDGDDLVFNGIPCYKNDTLELGLYDSVNNQFLTNAGTGTFITDDVTYNSLINS